MKAIVGVRHADGAFVFTRSAAGCRELPSRQDLFDHPVPGFDWGTESYGVAHLAAAIIAEICGNDARQVKHLLPTMHAFLMRLPKDDFEISESFLVAMLAAIQTQLSPSKRPLSRAGLWQWITPPPFAITPVRM